MSEWWMYVGASVFFPVDVSGRRAVPWFPTRASHDVEVPEPRSFDSVVELAAASDLVVRARVVAVGPGPTVEQDDARFQLRFVTLRPEEYLKGSSPTVLVRFAEPGYTLDGTGFTVNGMTWSEVGDEGWFFLARSGDEQLAAVSSYGKVATSGTTPGPTGVRPDQQGPWRGVPADRIEAVIRASV